MVVMAEDLSALYGGELNPVGPKAQKKVPLPEGLDLDAWINEPPPPEEEDDQDDMSQDSGREILTINVYNGQSGPSACPFSLGLYLVGKLI